MGSCLERWCSCDTWHSHQTALSHGGHSVVRLQHWTYPLLSVHFWSGPCLDHHLRSNSVTFAKPLNSMLSSELNWKTSLELYLVLLEISYASFKPSAKLSLPRKPLLVPPFQKNSQSSHSIFQSLLKVSWAFLNSEIQILKCFKIRNVLATDTMAQVENSMWLHVTGYNQSKFRYIN